MNLEVAGVIDIFMKRVTKEHHVVIRITLVDLLGRCTSFFWDGCWAISLESESGCWLQSRLGNGGKFISHHSKSF